MWLPFIGLFSHSSNVPRLVYVSLFLADTSKKNIISQRCRLAKSLTTLQLLQYPRCQTSLSLTRFDPVLVERSAAWPVPSATTALETQDGVDLRPKPRPRHHRGDSEEHRDRIDTHRERQLLPYQNDCGQLLQLWASGINCLVYLFCWLHIQADTCPGEWWKLCRRRGQKQEYSRTWRVN